MDCNRSVVPKLGIEGPHKGLQDDQQDMKAENVLMNFYFVDFALI